MSDAESRTPAQEREMHVTSGFPVLTAVILLLPGGVALAIAAAVKEAPALAVVGVFVILASVFLACGFFTIAPNVARVIQLFGAYKGTVRDTGFRWANPFYSKRQVSLRAHNLNGEKIKVNDRAGN